MLLFCDTLINFVKTALLPYACLHIKRLKVEKIYLIFSIMGKLKD